MQNLSGFHEVHTITGQGDMLCRVVARSNDDLQQVLWAENVLAQRYFWTGCHRMEPYCSRDPGLGSRLPATEEVAGRVLCLPGGPGVERGQIATVCDIVRSVAERATEVRRRLSASRAPSAA